MMRVTITSEYALAAIETLRLPDESASACVDRVLVALLPIASDFEAFFGPQVRKPGRKEAKVQP